MAVLFFGVPAPCSAETIGDLLSGDREHLSVSLRILALVTVLTLVPSIVLLTTSFLRLVVVLSFIRRALGTMELPPNQVVIGLSLVLTIMIMFPTWGRVSGEAIDPYLRGEITEFDEMWARAQGPIREFMFRQMDRRDLEVFIGIAKIQPVDQAGRVVLGEIPLRVVVPAFVTSELRRAFLMGFVIYLPFLIIDLVVASVLISMGMLVLPPILVSLPFKILVFVLVDGWDLVVSQLVQSFYGG